MRRNPAGVCKTIPIPAMVAVRGGGAVQCGRDWRVHRGGSDRGCLGRRGERIVDADQRLIEDQISIGEIRVRVERSLPARTVVPSQAR
jgi:hypothetical protein